jgi:O-antigen/teichoic acid export membrane protein
MYGLARMQEGAAFSLVAGSVLLVWVLGASQKWPELRLFNNPAHVSSPEMANKLLVVGLPAMLTAPAFWLLSSADRWFLGISASTADVGIYAIGVSFGTLGMMLNSAVLSAWVPEVIREYETTAEQSYQSFGHAKRLLILAYALVWVFIVVFSPELIQLLVDPRYQQAVTVVPWIAAGVFFYGVAQLYNTVFLLERRMIIMARVWLAAVVVSLLCNSWIVPQYGIIGAAIVQCFSFAIAAFLQWWFSQKIKHIDVFTPRVLLQLAACLIIGIVGHQFQLQSLALTAAVKGFVLALLAGAFFWQYIRTQNLPLFVGRV